jgi:hypothetical protein
MSEIRTPPRGYISDELDDGNAQIAVIARRARRTGQIDSSRTVVAGQKEQRTSRERRRNQAEARHSILRFGSQANDQNNYESKVIREPVKERRSFAGISAFMVS